MDRDFGVVSSGSGLGQDPLTKYNSPLATSRTGESSATYQSKSYSATSSSVGAACLTTPPPP